MRSRTSTQHWVRYEHEVDFLEPLVSSNRSGGRTFGVSAFGSVAGVWYRRRELAALGLEPPRTWDELRSVAKALVAGGMPHPVVMPGGSKGGETTAYCLIAFLASNGARVLDADRVSIASRRDRRDACLPARLDRGRLMRRGGRRLRMDAPDQTVRRGQGGVERRRKLRGADACGGVRRVDARALGARRVHSGSGGSAWPSGERRRLNELCDLPAGAAAAVGHARAGERGRAARARARRAGNGRVPARRSAVELAAPDLPFLSQSAEILGSAVTRPTIPLYARARRSCRRCSRRCLPDASGRLRPPVMRRS